MVPPYSDRIPRVPPYSSSSQPVCFRVRDCHPVPCDFPDASTNTQADSDSGLLPVRSPLLGESRLILFLGVLRCFSFPVRLVNLYSVNDSVTNHTGFPHSDIAGSRFISPRRAFRRLARPSSPLDWGIHRVPLSRLTSQPGRCFTSDCENLRDQNTPLRCRFNFQLDPDFKKSKTSENLFQVPLKFSWVRSKRWWSCGIEPQTSCVQSRRSPAEL